METTLTSLECAAYRVRVIAPTITTGVEVTGLAAAAQQVLKMLKSLRATDLPNNAWLCELIAESKGKLHTKICGYTVRVMPPPVI